MSNPLPCGTPSTTSTRTTSASSLSAIRKAQFAPTFPAPTTVTFFRKLLLLFGIMKHDYNVWRASGLPQRGQRIAQHHALPAQELKPQIKTLGQVAALEIGRQHV